MNIAIPPPTPRCFAYFHAKMVVPQGGRPPVDLHSPPSRNSNTPFFVLPISGTISCPVSLPAAPSAFLIASRSQAGVQSSGPNLRPGLFVKQASGGGGGSLSRLAASRRRNAAAQHVTRLRNGAAHQTPIRSLTLGRWERAKVLGFEEQLPQSPKDIEQQRTG